MQQAARACRGRPARNATPMPSASGHCIGWHSKAPAALTVLAVTTLVAVLDTRRLAEHWWEEDRLMVNWVVHGRPFDFDEVHIGEADDEAVERLCIQMANDPVIKRRQRYRRMKCTISSHSALSENTWRMLARSFGQVLIESC